MASRLINLISLMSDMASKLDAFTSTSQHCLVSKVTVTPLFFNNNYNMFTTLHG